MFRYKLTEVFVVLFGFVEMCLIDLFLFGYWGILVAPFANQKNALYPSIWIVLKYSDSTSFPFDFLNLSQLISPTGIFRNCLK